MSTDDIFICSNFIRKYVKGEHDNKVCSSHINFSVLKMSTDESRSNISQGEFPELWCYGCGIGMHEKNSIKCQCGSIVCKNCQIISNYKFMCKLCVPIDTSNKKCDICHGDFFSYNCEHTGSCGCTTYISCKKCERIVCLKCGRLSEDLCSLCNDQILHICDRCNRIFETKLNIPEKVKCDSCSEVTCPMCRSTFGKDMRCFTCLNTRKQKCGCSKEGNVTDVCVVCNEWVCTDCEKILKCVRCTKKCKVTCKKVSCVDYMENVCCMKNCDKCEGLFCSTCYRGNKCLTCITNINKCLTHITQDKKCGSCQEKITTSEVCISCNGELCTKCLRWSRCECGTKVWICDKCCQYCGKVCVECVKERNILRCHYNAKNGVVSAKIHFMCVPCNKKYCNSCTPSKNVHCLGCGKELTICFGHKEEEIFCGGICNEKTEKCSYCERASCRNMHYCEDSPGCEDSE
jgi:hypothetical protein